MPLSKVVTALKECKGTVICIYGCTALPSEAHEYMLHKVARPITPFSKAFFTTSYRFNNDYLSSLHEIFIENKDDTPFLFSQFREVIEKGKNVVIYGATAPTFADIHEISESEKSKIRFYTCDS